MFFVVVFNFNFLNEYLLLLRKTFPYKDDHNDDDNMLLCPVYLSYTPTFFPAIWTVCQTRFSLNGDHWIILNQLVSRSFDARSMLTLLFYVVYTGLWIFYTSEHDTCHIQYTTTGQDQSTESVKISCFTRHVQRVTCVIWKGGKNDVWHGKVMLHLSRWMHSCISCCHFCLIRENLGSWFGGVWYVTYYCIIWLNKVLTFLQHAHRAFEARILW